MSATIETQRVIIQNVVLYCNNTFASLEEEAAFNMKTGFFVVLLFFIPSLLCFSQDPLPHYTECIPIQDLYLGRGFKTNSQKEIYINSGQSLIKLDKHGNELWREPASFDDFWLDESENVCFVNYTFISEPIYSFSRYAPDGTVNSFTYPVSNISGVAGDRFANTYVLQRFPMEGDQGLSEILFWKFDATGNFEPPKSIAINTSSASIKVSESGDVFVLLEIQEVIDGETLRYFQVAKIGGDGTALWRTSFPPKPTDYYHFFSFAIDNTGSLVAHYSDPLTNASTIFKIDGTSGIVGQPVPTDPFAYGLKFYFLEDKIYTSINEQLFIFSNDLVLQESFLLEASVQPNEPITIYKDATGHLIISGRSFINLTSATYILKYKNGQLVWKFLTRSEGPGDILINFENNILYLDDDCLGILYECDDENITILNQPENLDACTGEEVSFETAVQGKGLSFFWYKDGVQLVPSDNYEGINTAVLTIKQVSLLDAGRYHCTIRDVCRNFSDTDIASLAIVPLPLITEQPDDATRCVGIEAILSITATGGKNVKYQWKKGNTALVESASYVGTKTGILTITAPQLSDAGEYYCEVTADCQSLAIVSQKATLTIQSPTSIAKHPESVTSCEGKSTSLSVSASGTQLAYQWKRNGNDIFETGEISGTNTNTITFESLTKEDAGEYTCVITGSCGPPVTSLKAVLIVSTEQEITSDPENSTVCSGTTGKFSITASGTGATYQWVKGNTLLTNNTKFSGVNTSTLTISQASVADEGSYACVITSSCGNKLSSKAAQLTVSAAASITETSPSLTRCSGERVKLYVKTSEGSATYQWKKDGTILTDMETLVGSNTSELHIDNIGIDAAGTYICTVTPSCGLPITSAPVTLTVIEHLVITEEPLTQVLCEDEPLELAVSVEGSPVSYQWKFNGENKQDVGASGAKTNRLTIHSTKTFDEGYYVCEVTGCNGMVATKPVLIKINKKPKLVLNTAICDNPYPEWSDIVSDQNSTHGEYLLFKKGSDVPLEGLMDISQTGVYTIVKQTETCSGTVEWNNTCLITEIEQDNSDNFTITTNPTSRWITFQYTPNEYIDFELYDSKGVRVSDGKLPEQGEITLDGNDLHGGLYIVRVTNAKGGVDFQRLILAR